MISLSLDPGGGASVLSAFADAAFMHKLVKVAAQTYVDETLNWIGQGKAFTGRTGILEQSIDWRSADSNTAEVFANAEYAGWVEFGTKQHVIEPKPGRKALKIPSGNGFFFARKVNHPGSKPHPFFFADQSNRENKMQTAMISVLAAHAGVKNG